jgi:hypothetical protein
MPKAPTICQQQEPEKKRVVCGKQFPSVYSRLILHLEDGAQVRGVWTGTKWWAEGRQVHPARWEYEKRANARQKQNGRPPT